MLSDSVFGPPGGAGSNPAAFIDKTVPLTIVRDETKNELIDVLQSLRGSKCLVLEQQLGGLLNHIIVEGSKLLKENGVQDLRELRPELGEFGRDAPDNIIYLVRPNLSLMKIIARQIQGCIKTGDLRAANLST
jgi:hypothetical protein